MFYALRTFSKLAHFNLVQVQAAMLSLNCEYKRRKDKKENMFQRLGLMAAPAALSLLLTMSPLKANSKDDVTFKMVVSAGAATCLPNASATVNIRSAGEVEIMDVTVEGLPPRTDFDFFVIQVPKNPFGIAWYQGDIQTDRNGRGRAQFVGRFSIETFALANGSANAPVVFSADASSNPSFNPVQMYHLGLWFDSPNDAMAAKCPATNTFFNGQHNAGLQVLNTSNFADDHGPLRDVNPSQPKP
jgi:hypothetical protein